MLDWRLGIRVAAVLLAGESRCAPAYAQDQSGCSTVRFAPGATSVTIRGKTTLDGAECYTFRAAADQDAHLRVSGENAFVSVIDVGNTRNGLIFKTKLRTYKFVVRQIRRVAPVEPYTVVLSVVDDIPSSRPLDGTWEFDYSCAGATGPYFDRCRAGGRDDFTLSIAQIGARFCGSYELTAQMGNHVDDGGLSDWAFTTTANQTYRVHFHVSGRFGEATMRVDGKKLHWKVLTEHEHDEGEPLTWSFMPPSSAIMDRKTTYLGGSPSCNE